MEMTFRKMTKDDIPAPGDHWMEVTQGMSGYFAVEMWMNDERDDLGPFAEPWDTGFGRYNHKQTAVAEAVLMAEELNIPYNIPEANHHA